MHRTAADFAAHEHDRTGIFGLQAIALDERCLRDDFAGREQRYDGASAPLYFALELGVFRWKRSSETIADEGDRRVPAGKRTAMGCGVDPQREPGDHRFVRPARQCIREIARFDWRRPAADDGDAASRNDAANVQRSHAWAHFDEVGVMHGRRVEGREMPHIELEITPATNIRDLVARLPVAAQVMEAFGLGCCGCGVSRSETIEQGALAHGLRVEPILAALQQARLSGFVPLIPNEDRRPAQRAPGAFRGRGKIAHVVAIMSGKGGVGKSLVTALIALGLRRRHLRVGILDADITGPSIPKLFGLRTPLTIEADPHAKTPQGNPQPLMVPAVTRSAIEVVSSNLLTDKEDTAMIWRGPILTGVIRQFFEQVLWSELDFLLIDLPPGTSDAPLTVLQSLSIDGVVLVTMPQALATMIVRKAANLVRQLKKPVLGVVENMSYFTAPDTGTTYQIFGPSYADRVAELAQAPVLARIPIDPSKALLADEGRIEEVDDPVCDELATQLLAAIEAHPKPKETISII
jgi:hybrid cluster-associated redox disulfide protein